MCLFAGSTNKEFSFRHDWNSLITDDSSLSMRHYSKDYFPKADDYVRLLLPLLPGACQCVCMVLAKASEMAVPSL